MEAAVAHVLRNYGHDVEHVDDLTEFGKGTADRRLAVYARREDRVLVTYDDDFVTEIDAAETSGVVFVSADATAAGAVADAIHRMSEQYPQSEFETVEWLDPWL